MKKSLKELLYRSFDERLTPAEQQLLEDALASDPELQEEQNELRTLRHVLGQTNLPDFPPSFADRVMRTIRTMERHQIPQEMWWESLVQVFKPVAIAAAITVLSLIAFNLSRSDQLSISGAFAAPHLSLEEAVDPTLTLALEMPE